MREVSFAADSMEDRLTSDEHHVEDDIEIKAT